MIWELCIYNFHLQQKKIKQKFFFYRWILQSNGYLCKAPKAQASSAEPNPSLGREIFSASLYTKTQRRLYLPPRCAAFHLKKRQKNKILAERTAIQIHPRVCYAFSALHMPGTPRGPRPSNCVPSAGG